MLFARIPTKFLARIAQPVLIWLFWSLPVHAECSALPVLSELVSLVEDLNDHTEREDIVETGRQMVSTRAALTKAGLMRNLSENGFERNLKSLLHFRIKLGVLAQYAIVGDVQKVASFLKSSDFQRRYVIAEELVAKLCDTRRESLASADGNSAGGGSAGLLLSRLGSSSQNVTVIFGLVFLCIVLLAAVVVATILRNRFKIREKRRNKRFACDMPVEVRALTQTITLKIVDISRTGANLESAFDLPIDSRLNLEFAGLQMKGTVTWSNSEFSGIEFDDPIEADEIARILKEFGGAEVVIDEESNAPQVS